MKNEILVFDDIIDLDHQDKIKSILTGDGQHKDIYFPWYRALFKNTNSWLSPT